MNKRDRQQQILSLIRARPIGTQEDLRALLERSGVPATQSSVSRDLEELGVVKHHGHYTLPRTNGAATRGLLSLDQAGDTLIIARTVPGLASQEECNRLGVERTANPDQKHHPFRAGQYICKPISARIEDEETMGDIKTPK